MANHDANQNKDTSQELLNNIDSELTGLTKLMAELLGKALMLKTLFERLRENQDL